MSALIPEYAVEPTKGNRVMPRYTLEQQREIIAQARALLAKPAAAAEDKPAAVHARDGLVFKTRDEALVIDAKPKVVRRKDNSVSDDDGLDALSANASAYASSQTLTTDPWWKWVEQHCDYRINVTEEAIGQVIGEFQVEASAHCEREVGIVKRELELMRRELSALREQVALERRLRDLRAEVEEACREVPKMPAIAARLEAEQVRLRGELDATKNQLRVNQSITDYGLAELRKQARAATRAAVELQTSTSRFVMRDIHPAAARTLHEFASEVVGTWDRRAIWTTVDPAGTA